MPKKYIVIFMGFFFFFIIWKCDNMKTMYIFKVMHIKWGMKHESMFSHMAIVILEVIYKALCFDTRPNEWGTQWDSNSLGLVCSSSLLTITPTEVPAIVIVVTCTYWPYIYHFHKFKRFFVFGFFGCFVLFLGFVFVVFLFLFCFNQISSRKQMI